MASVFRDRKVLPSYLQQLLQLEETCGHETRRPFLIQLDLQMQQASFDVIGGSLAQHAVQRIDIHICLNLLGCRACLMKEREITREREREVFCNASSLQSTNELWLRTNCNYELIVITNELYK